VIHSDKFRVHHLWYTNALLCNTCEIRDFGSGDIYVWTDTDDMILSALISLAEAHWTKFHATPSEDSL